MPDPLEQFKPSPRQVQEIREIRERDGIGLHEARRAAIFDNLRAHLPRHRDVDPDLERVVDVVEALITMVEKR